MTAPNAAAGAVVQDVRRDAGNAEDLERHVGAVTDRPLQAVSCFDEVLEKRRRLAGLLAQPDDLNSIAVALMEIDEPRQLGPARRAPAGPEIDEHHFAAQVFGSRRPLGV